MTSSILLLLVLLHFYGAFTLFRATADSMTATLTGIDAHAQTDGRQQPGKPFFDAQVSSKRPPKKLAIGLMPF
jgi:hypothetical protein